MPTYRMVYGDDEQVVREVLDDVEVAREDGWTVVFRGRDAILRVRDEHVKSLELQLEPPQDATLLLPAVGEDSGEWRDVSGDPAADEHDRLVASLPAGSALLVVKRGPNAGHRFRLDRDVTTAGRHPDSDVLLDDVTVSRRHAEFLRADGEFSVRDVGSLNGTYVNRQSVREAVLAAGDHVQIGKFQLLFLAGPRGAVPGSRGRTGSTRVGQPG